MSLLKQGRLLASSSLDGLKNWGREIWEASRLAIKSLVWHTEVKVIANSAASS
jgi:hypothetical protein